ncbi:MAG TPA: hypothetical protein DD409_09265 [Bacteroidales bacterium]|jgi:hypothetical protein|nr:MAG: hypothetical protein BWY72_00476 [Bacteroidetes bacterium ADurb.Bin416]HBL73036.1 hypothetical protein [Bacteroidales bacterium]
MNNRFEEVMSKKTDEALRYILDAPEGTYQAEALVAARQEWEKRVQSASEPFVANDVVDEPAKPITEDQQPCKPTMSYESHQAQPIHEGDRYPALKLIAGFYKVLAWLVLVGAFLGLAALAALDMLTLWRGVGLFLGAGLLFVSLMALSELIRLFIDMEKNTRHGFKNQ